VGRNSRRITVSWKQSNGETWQTHIEFKKETGYRYQGNLVIVMGEGIEFHWWLTQEMHGPTGDFQKLTPADGAPIE
jgi:hypothetical protein